MHRYTYYAVTLFHAVAMAKAMLDGRIGSDPPTVVLSAVIRQWRPGEITVETIET